MGKCEHAREGKTGDERRCEEGNQCKKVYNYKFDSIYTTDILNVLKSLDDWKSFKNKPMSM